MAFIYNNDNLLVAMLFFKIVILSDIESQNLWRLIIGKSPMKRENKQKVN